MRARGLAPATLAAMDAARRRRRRFGIRRAERCIGLAIRKGQAEGRIKKRGQGGGKPPGAKRDRSDNGISCPTDFATASELSGNASGIYAMTDNVPAEAFEAAITEGKAEGRIRRRGHVRSQGTTTSPDGVRHANRISQTVKTYVIDHGHDVTVVKPPLSRAVAPEALGSLEAKRHAGAAGPPASASASTLLRGAAPAPEATS